MGIEQRRTGIYLYRKERQGNQVRSIYEGRLDSLGVIAVMSRACIRLGRAHSDEPYYRQATAFGDDAVELLGQLCSSATRALLRALGFHQHRGQWRLKHAASRSADASASRPLTTPGHHRITSWKLEHLQTPRSQAQSSPTLTPMKEDRAFKLADLFWSDPEQPLDLPPFTQEMAERDIRALLADLACLLKIFEAGIGDQPSEQAARDVVLQHPTLWAESGAIALRVALHLACICYPDSVEGRRTLLVGMDRCRLKLGYLEASAPLRLLIDQAVIVWAHLQVSTVVGTLIGHDNTMAPKFGPYWAERLKELERRFARMIEALERTRKLTQQTKRTRAATASVPDERDGQPALKQYSSYGKFVPRSTQALGAHAFYQPGMDLLTSDERTALWRNRSKEARLNVRPSPGKGLFERRAHRNEAAWWEAQRSSAVADEPDEEFALSFEEALQGDDEG